MIRAKAGGLEILFSGRPFADAYDELRERLAASPDFYRGASATVVLAEAPSSEQLHLIASTLDGAGIEWDGAYGLDSGVAPLPKREPPRDVVLSDNARSLVADFEGARKDLAGRRQRGERRIAPALKAVAPRPVAAPQPEPRSEVLYHRGTLRGGQSLANVGHIVVIGDVNPGAELVAGGDIVVFGALRGVAHAGAQGDRSARVYALVLEPTQLRIATTIAAGAERTGAPVPEEAFLAEAGDRIAIAPAGQPPHLKSTAEQS
ncbi:MAG TPA: septum site-determining protein MinC [Candidatus Acidoferrales bacterium]|nr:septum site-determining protein MinC [Candidatus Acidoferrales bacterium]